MFRPPILQAASTLGIKDADVARLLNLTPVTVSEWARNIRPVPPARQMHLCFAAKNLLDQLRRTVPTSERDARRHRVTIEVAEKWLEVAHAEIGKDLLKEVLEGAEPDYGLLPGLDSAEIERARTTNLHRALAKIQRAGRAKLKDPAA